MAVDRERLAVTTISVALLLCALLLCGVAAWLAIIMLGGWLIAALFALAAGAVIGSSAWWLHTDCERNARRWLRKWRREARAALPRAQVRRRGRGRR